MSRTTSFGWHPRSALPLLTMLLVLAGCGGGDGGGGSGDTSTPAATATLAHVEVLPASVLLRPGDVAHLSARVTDSNGAVVNGAVVSWHSSDSAVSVAADGTLTAGSTVATSLITATVDAISSAPVAALVAKPVDGAQMVADDQVVADPKLVDTTQVPGPGAQLRMTLAGNNAPAVGSLLLGSGSKGIGGKVVSTAASGTNTDVVFEVLPLTEMFTQLKFSQTFQPSALTTKFDVQPTTTTTRLEGGREYTFVIDTPDTPAPASASSRATAQGARALGLPLIKPYKWNVGPFKCKASAEAAPVIGFRKMTPTIIDNMGVVSAIISVEAGAFYVELQSQGSMKMVVDGEIHVGGGLKGSVACDARLITHEIQVPPVVALVFIPTVPVFGLRTKVSGELQDGDIAIGIKSEVEQPARLGLRIDPDGTVTDLSNIDRSQMKTKFEWTINEVGSASGTFRFIGDANAGLYAQAAFTNRLLGGYHDIVDQSYDPYKSLVEGYVGLHPSVTLATVNQQLQDPTLTAGYQVKAQASIGLGSDLAEAFSWLSKLVKLTGVTAPSIPPYEPLLFSQPTGKARVSLRSFNSGEQLTFRVTLDPDSVEPTFLGEPTVGYNVKQVEIWRKTPGATSQRIGLAAGAPGQNEFIVNWTADTAGTTTDSRSSADPASFYAVVVPNFGSSFGFRVAPALGWLGVIQLGAGNDQEGRKVAVDAQGNVIIATYSSDPLAYEKRSSVGGYDEIQIVKLDPYGQAVWMRNIDGPGDELVSGLAVDSAGVIYLAGTAFASPLTDAGTGANGFSGWAARIEPNGDLTWLKQWQEPNSAYSTATDVALGPNHELYVYGTTATAPLGTVGGTVFSFDCSKVSSTRNEPGYDCGNAILIRLDAHTGSRIWASVDVRAGMQVARGMTVDAGGNIYTACQTFVDTETQNAGESSDPGYDDFAHRYREPIPNTNNFNQHSGACFAMWAPDGTVIWRSNLKNERANTPTGYVYSDEWPVGIVATGGQVWTMIRSSGSFPGGSPNAGQLDSALFSLNSLGGTPTLGTLYGTDGVDALSLTGPTPGGDMLVVGYTTGSLFGPNVGGRDVAVAKLGPDGSMRWSRQFGGPGNDMGWGAGAAQDGTVFVTGSTDGLLPDTLSGPVTGGPRNVAAGNKDLFIAKLSPLAGTIQSAPRTHALAVTTTPRKENPQ